MRWQCVHCGEPMEKDHDFCMGCGRMLEERERVPVEEAVPAPVSMASRTLGRPFFAGLATLCGALFLVVFLLTQEEPADGVKALLYGTLVVLFFTAFGFALKVLLEKPWHTSSNPPRARP